MKCYRIYHISKFDLYWLGGSRKLQLEKILHKHFGYLSFRPGQKEVIEKLIEGQDVIALLPTGMGKSLCYQLPGYVFHKPVLIVSPLLSLMQDQVDQMKQFGEKRVVALNSFLNNEQKKYAVHYLNEYRFIFISPEMLLQPYIKQKLTEIELSLIVVDEAHCISQWGFDFRPDYLRIGDVFQSENRPPILALSATATEKVLGDIKQYLKIKNPFEYIHSIDRPNLHYSRVLFHEKEEKINWILDHVSKTAGPGIIYVQSRTKAENLSARLLQIGVQTATYHAGKEPEDRQFIQHQFIEGALDWIVATNAFGMGVHKQNIRQIIHETLPSNVENYMQEVGRAGRDGGESLAILLYADSDENIAEFIASTDLPNEFQVENYYSYILRNENPIHMLESGEISETSYRVLHYWMTQHPPEKVKFVLQSMKKAKIQSVNEMMNLVRTSGCLRELLVNYFGQELEERPDNCCETCGISYEALVKPREMKVNVIETHELTWQSRMKKILLGK